MNNNEILLGTYHPTGDFIAIILCILLLFIFDQVAIRNHRNHNLFMGMFFSIIVGSISNIAFSLIVNNMDYTEGLPLYMLYLTRGVYHSMLLISVYLFINYLVDILELKEKITKRIQTILAIVLIVSVGLDVTSPVTKFGFYYDKTSGVFHDASWVKPYTIGYVIFFLIIGVLLIQYGSRLFRKVRLSLLASEILFSGIMFFQACMNGNTMASIAFMFPILTVMFMIHTNSYNLNTGTLGEESLIEFLQSKTGMHKIYCFVFDDYNRLTNPEAKIYFCNFWYKYMKHGNAFFIDNNTLLLLISDNQKSSEEDYEFLAKSVQGFAKFNLHTSAVLFNHELTTTFDDFVFNMDFAKSRAIKNSAYIFSKADADNMAKQKYILDQLRDIAHHGDLHDDRVLVYCQPVMNVKRKRFDTAEALMRLELPEYGMIQPNLFIPLAEKYKLVHYLSLIIFNKVCEAIKYFDEAGYELNRISVNFAVQEFRNTEFASELVKIIQDNQIASDRIAIEITESENEEEFQVIQRVIAQLKELQIHLYLDDFGTGYSNFDRIFNLKLNVVKFDRSFLLMADQDEKSKFLINHFSKAFSQMGYEVLYEGVETEEQEKLCMSANADYLQGYKYGKPVSIYSLVDFLSRKDDVQMN